MVPLPAFPNQCSHHTRSLYLRSEVNAMPESLQFITLTTRPKCTMESSDDSAVVRGVAALLPRWLSWTATYFADRRDTKKYMDVTKYCVSWWYVVLPDLAEERSRRRWKIYLPRNACVIAEKNWQPAEPWLEQWPKLRLQEKGL